ncbi:MAG: TonB-dependent receptor [Magnetospirillum sp.]|nr:TonB-dependent receptor [Magnetospirillum sp.]
MRFWSCMVAVPLVAAAFPGAAQVMDYGGLEAMFGGPVTVSATGSPQRATDAPVNMEIVTADDIRRSGADNVPDILRHLAGIDVRRYGNASADIGIRGYNSANSSRVLVLLNGRQIYVDFYAYTAWPTLPVQLEEIRQIEVIKGPNSALYGFNAVAGVINIVTVDPIFDAVQSATARVGSQANQQLSGVGTIRLGDRAGLRLSASERGAREFAVNDPATFFGATPDNAFNRSVYAHGRAVLPTGIDVSAEVDVTDAKQYEMALGGFPAWTTYQTNREKLGVGRETGFGYLNLNAYRNWVEYQYLAGYNCRTCTGIVNELYVVQASTLMKPASDHTVRLGLEFRDNTVRGSIYAGAEAGLRTLAPNAMWNWQATPTVALTNSLRLDHMESSYSGPVAATIAYSASEYDGIAFTEPSFNSAAVYRPTADDTFRATVARGVQIPSFQQLFPQPVDSGFTVGPPNGRTYQGAPIVKPTVVMNYEAAYARALPEIASKAELALFTQSSRGLSAAPGDAGFIGANGVNYAGNIGRSTAVGGELTLKGADAEGWRWRASYAVVAIDDDLGVTGNVSTADFAHGTPTHAAGLGLGRSWRRFEIDVFGRWQSHFDELRVNDAGTALERRRIKDYFIADARLGWEATDFLRLAVSGQQLNQTRQTVDAGPAVERRVLGTVTLHY